MRTLNNTIIYNVKDHDRCSEVSYLSVVVEDKRFVGNLSETCKCIMIGKDGHVAVNDARILECLAMQSTVRGVGFGSC